MSPTENYLTEMLAWMIDNLPQFGHDYVQLLSAKCMESAAFDAADLFPVSAKTQVKVKTGFIDMVVITNHNIGFICEHKTDSLLSDDQIQKYYDHSDEIDDSLVFKTVLLTKHSKQHTQDSDIALTWHELYEFFSRRLENGEYDSGETMITEQFLMYLTEVGMGRKDSIRIGSVEHYCEAMKLDQTLKSIFSDIVTDKELETKCCGIREFVSSYDPSVPARRWGRIGIEFSDSWEPGIFAGVILDNKDHQLREFNDQPQLVVLIDCDPERSSDILSKPGFKNIMANIPDSENGFIIDRSPQSKWRSLILQKPLKDVLRHNEYEEQKNDIMTEIISGINIILKYYGGTK